MNVLLTAVAFSEAISGVQRHAFNLSKALLTQPQVETVHMVVAPWQLASTIDAVPNEDERFQMHVAPMERHALGRNLWHILSLPRLVKELQLDIVHLTYPVPFNPLAIGVPVITTLHDLYPFEHPENFGSLRASVQRWILRQCLADCDAIAAVSNCTSEQMRRFLPDVADLANVTRIYNAVVACDDVSSRCPVPALRNVPFLLCVAQHRKNKNLGLLLSAMSRMLRTGQLTRRTQLLIVGIAGPESMNLRTTAVRLGLAASVHFVDGLSEASLQWCYRNAEALVLASGSEGFGLPVPEAVLAGCRVVCSDLPVLHEVGAPGCTYFSLDGDPEANLIEAILFSLSRPRPAPIQLPQFSLGCIGAQYLELYERVLARVPAPHPLLSTSPQAERHLS